VREMEKLQKFRSSGEEYRTQESEFRSPKILQATDPDH
jgi:hypothetical protein